MSRAPAAALLLLVLAVPAARGADEETDAAASTMVRTSDGLKFVVPPDWPIEKRNGIVAPIPIEEYLNRKFSGLERKVQALEEKVSALESKLSVLEARAKKPLQSSEAAAP